MMKSVGRDSALVILVAFLLGGVLLVSVGMKPATEEPEPHTSNEAGAQTRTIRIGLLSATNSTHPHDVYLGELAREEINAYCEDSGLRLRFEFVYNCAAGRAPDALGLTEWYHENGIDLVIGYYWGSQLHASMRCINENNMTVITPQVDVYFWAGIWPNVIRLSPHSFRQMEPLARMMRALGATHIVIIHNNDHWENDFLNGFPHGNLTGFIEEFEGLGGNVTDVIPYPPEYWTMGPDGYMVKSEEYLGEAESAIEGIQERTGGAAVLLVGYPGGAESLLMKAVEYPALINVTWFTPEPSSTHGILDYAGEAAAQLKLLHPSLTFKKTAAYDRVDEAYRGEFDLTLGYQGAGTYDACWLMALSVIEANTTDPTTIRDVLPVIASNYTGASGPCAIESSYYRAAADYDLYGFFRIGKEIQCLKCGFYDGATESITWDETLTREAKETG
jgi:ABC-type branched-subunit amino acid transport system substrate-binding protein